MKLGAGIWLLALAGCGDQATGTGTPGGGPPALSFGTSTVVFPDAVIGHIADATRSIAVTNVSGEPVTPTFRLSGGPDFAIDSTTCDLLLPGVACDVVVHFAPQALGGRSAALVATAAGTSIATTLAGIGLPEPGLNANPPSALDYEDVEVGVSKTLQITIVNGSLVIAKPYAVALTGADAPDFTITADTCSGVANRPSETCTVDVAFAPSVASPRSAQLVVSSANLGTLMIALGGKGFRRAQLVVSPDRGMFGSVFLPGQSAISFTVTNTGTVPTPAQVQLSMSGLPNFFNLTDGCTGQTLAGGASCMFSILYAPRSAGTSETTVTVLAGSLAVVVPLSGTGEPAQLRFTPPALNFGDLFLGQTSTVQTLTLENTGSTMTGPLTARLLSINSDLAIVTDACTGVDLAPAATCTVSVQVTANTRITGSGSIQVTAMRGDHALAPLQYRGVIGATLAATPDSAALGDVQLTENPRQTFTLTNVGDLDTGTMTVTVAGTDAADVSLVENCTGRSLPSFVQCSVTASFSPSHLGAEAASVAITSPGAATLTIPIDANVLPAPQFTVSPDAVVLNPVAVGEPVALTFVVQGTGDITGPLSVQLTGPNTAEYTTTADDCTGRTLAASQACTITLALTPAATGSRSAVLVVAGSPGGYRKVPLTGIAFTQASLQISPPAITFAATGIGHVDEFGFLSIKNTGQLPTGTLTAQVVGQDPGEFLVQIDTCSGAVLAANAECEVLMNFVPTKVATSTATVIVSAVPGGTVTASLTGTGLPPPVITSPITSFDFAPQETFTAIGNYIRIDNIGGSSTGQLHATLTGPQADQFTADDFYCFDVPAGGRCDLPITFLPTQVGQASATLVVDSPISGSVTIALSGTATAGTKITVSPDVFDFGFLVAGDSSPVQSFIATNIGQRDVAKFHVFSCDNFPIVATTCGSTLGPSASCQIDVVFHPVSHIFGPCRLVFVEDNLLKGEAELRGQSTL